jgi:large subunit ribosomal protein L17
VVGLLITLGRTGANHPLAVSRLRDVEVAEKRFNEIGPRWRVRSGGYTRILRRTARPRDCARMALVQISDRPEPQST